MPAARALTGNGKRRRRRAFPLPLEGVRRTGETRGSPRQGEGWGCRRHAIGGRTWRRGVPVDPSRRPTTSSISPRLAREPPPLPSPQGGWSRQRRTFPLPLEGVRRTGETRGSPQQGKGWGCRRHAGGGKTWGRGDPVDPRRHPATSAVFPRLTREPPPIPSPQGGGGRQRRAFPLPLEGVRRTGETRGSPRQGEGWGCRRHAIGGTTWRSGDRRPQPPSEDVPHLAMPRARTPTLTLPSKGGGRQRRGKGWSSALAMWE